MAKKLTLLTLLTTFIIGIVCASLGFKETAHPEEIVVVIDAGHGGEDTTKRL